MFGWNLEITWNLERNHIYINNALGLGGKNANISLELVLFYIMVIKICHDNNVTMQKIPK